MILPIVAYGDPVLRKECDEIDDSYDKLDELIENMFETMYNAPGVGLAAPQIGLAIRLFVVDSLQITESDDDEDLEDVDPSETGIKQAFINPIIIKEYGKPFAYEEGCLSIPGIRENVTRNDSIEIEYQDKEFNTLTKVFTGITARVIQHEYDHIEGILFTDHLKPLKKRFLRGKLNDIAKGKVDVAYKMRFPQLKKSR